MARITGTNRCPRLFFCVTDWQDTIALLLGTASASITLDGSQFFGTADQAMAKMDQLGSYQGKGGTSFFDRMSKGALALGTALVVPMGVGLQAAIDLEQAMANLNASLGGVDASQLDSLASSIQEIGANSKFSATEVALVSDELAKAGVSAENLIGVTEAVVNLSQATGEGLPVATSGITQAMAVWQEATVGTTLALTDASRAADILTVAANQSTGGVSDVVAGLRPLGPVAASMGISFDEAAAAIALFTQYGLSGAEAGTSLTRGLTNLADPTSEAADLMTELGIAAFDMEGNFVGFPSLFDQLNKSMAGMSDQAQLAALSTIFGAEAMDVMGLAILSGAEPLEAMIALMGESGAAAEQSALRMDTLGAQFDSLQEGVTTFLGSLVQGLIPGLRFLVDGANMIVDALMRIPDPIKTIIGAVAGFLAIFASVNIGLGAFGALNSLLGGVGISAGGAAGALGAVVAPILAIGAAVVGLYAIWRTNFLGLGDVLDQAFAPVVDVGRTIQTGFQGVANFVDRFVRAFNRVEEPARAAGKALDTVAGPLSAARNGFNALAGVTNRVTKPIAAFAKGFNAVSEAALSVLGPFQGVADAGGRFADTLRSAFSPMERVAGGLERFGGAASTASDAVTTLGRVFDALSFAIRGINGGEIPVWLEEVSDFFSAASEAADDFFGAFNAARNITLADGGSAFEGFIAGIRNALGTIDVGAIAIRVGSWLISAASDLWGAITSWVSDVALPAGAQAARTVWDVVVNIGSWAKGIVSDIWPYITTWAGEAAGAVTSAAATLWGVIVNIGSWAKGIVSDILPYVTSWVSDAISSVTSSAATLWGVIVNVGSWAQGIVSDIWPYISMWAQSAWSAVSTSAVTIWGVLVNIGSWAAGAIEDVWGFIERNVRIEYSKRPDQGILLGGVDITIGSFNVELEPMQLINSVNAAVRDALIPSDEQTSDIQALGEEHGASLMRQFMAGLGRGMSGGGGNGGGGFDLDTLIVTPDVVIRRWATPYFEGLFQGIADEVSGMDFSFDIPTPDVTWPDLPEIGTVPFVADFVELLGNIGTMFSDVSWSFDVSLPDINWPGIDDVLNTLPQWLKDFANMSPIDWAKKYALGGGDSGETASVEAPEINWGNIGTGLTIVSGNAALVALWLSEAASSVAGFASQAALANVQSTALAGGLGTVKDQLSTAFTGGLESAKTALVDLATTAQLQTLAMAMAGLQMGQAFAQGVVSGITSSAGNVTGALTTLMAPAQAARAQMALYGINAGLGYGTGVASGIRSQTGAVAGAAASYLAVVSGYRGAMMAAGIGIGAALGQGIAAGIRSQIGAVAAAAAAMVSTAVAAARSAGGIQSPSTVMRDQVGLNLALGTAEGILAGLPAIYSAANRMVYIPDVPNRGYAGGGGGSTVIYQTTVDARTTVEGNVTTEERLLDTFADRLSTGIADEVYRTSVAAGVAP